MDKCDAQFQRIRNKNCRVHFRRLKNMWRMVRTRFGSDTVSRELPGAAHEICSKSLRRNKNRSRVENKERIRCGWTDYMYHVGSTYDKRPMSEGCLIAGGITVRPGRPTCFFTAVDPMNISLLSPRGEPNEPRTIPFELGMYTDAHRNISV